MAIAITLLVLDIGINVHRAGSVGDFVNNINGQLENLIQPTISYLVTFLVIAMYWKIHRRLMQVVQRLDNHFISLTFVFLAFIAFFPVTSKLLGDYADARSVVIIYTLVLSGCGFSSLVLWLYATWKHRLVSPDFPLAEIHARTYTLLLTPLIFCVSLLLLFVTPQYQPYLICFSWALIGFIHKLGRSAYKHWLEKPVRALLQRQNKALAAAAAPAHAPITPEVVHVEPEKVEEQQ